MQTNPDPANSRQTQDEGKAAQEPTSGQFKRPGEKDRSAKGLTWIRTLVLILVVCLSVILLVMGRRIENLGRYGYPGIFLVNLLANATIILPIPGVVVTSAFGAVLHPFWVAIAAGSGAALGELSGFLAGFSGGRAVLERFEGHERVAKLFARYGDVIILFLALIPNPAFDLAGITAGTLKMPVRRFLFFCWVGKVIKMLVFAYTGATLLDLFGIS